MWFVWTYTAMRSCRTTSKAVRRHSRLRRDADCRARRGLCGGLRAGNPDMQREHELPISAPGEANMTMCASGVAARFRCPAYTLEMPFKDNANAPDAVYG